MVEVLIVFATVLDSICDYPVNKFAASGSLYSPVSGGGQNPLTKGPTTSQDVHPFE